MIEYGNFQWFGHNRVVVSKKAIRGSGGVGVFINKKLLSIFNIDVIDLSFDEVLWIKFQIEMASNCVLLLCVYYLPPSISSRGDYIRTIF